MRTLLIVCIYFGALVLLTSCSPDSKDLYSNPHYEQTPIPEAKHDPMPPTPDNHWITDDGGQSDRDFNPQVDILFLIDNSESMKTAQESLGANIERFAKGIKQNKMIDYHIGVISVWDSSERFINGKKDKFGMGDLRYVRGSDRQAYDQRFLTKNDSSKLSLAETLKIGIAPYAQGGPEKEEFFAPLLASLEKNGHGAVNEGFFRDNAQLVVVIMTDADEAKGALSAEDVAAKLIDFKGGNAKKLSVYGVLVSANDPDAKKDPDLRCPKNNRSCTPMGPVILENLVNAANPLVSAEERGKYVLRIYSNTFGSDLARIGDNITVKTLEKEIFLSQRPRVDENGTLMVRVRYGTPAELAKPNGGQIIPKQTDGGWTYDSENNSVRLPGNIKYNYKEGARFAVDIQPLNY